MLCRCRGGDKLAIETENERAFLCGNNGWMKYFKTNKSKYCLRSWQKIRSPFRDIWDSLKYYLNVISKYFKNNTSQFLRVLDNEMCFFLINIYHSWSRQDTWVLSWPKCLLLGTFYLDITFTSDWRGEGKGFMCEVSCSQAPQRPEKPQNPALDKPWTGCRCGTPNRWKMCVFFSKTQLF